MRGISVAICRTSRKTSNTNISETKDFSGFFIAYLECASNLEHFEKKDEHPSPVISEIIDSERVGYLNV